MENNIVQTVGVLIIDDNKVLLVKHVSGSDHLNNKYGLPAGRVDDGESLVVAARRELLEETGLSVDISNLNKLNKVWTAVIERKTGKQEFSLEVFVVNSYSGSLINSTETIPEWVDISNLNKYDLLPNVGEIVLVGAMFLDNK